MGTKTEAEMGKILFFAVSIGGGVGLILTILIGFLGSLSFTTIMCPFWGFLVVFAYGLYITYVGEASSGENSTDLAHNGTEAEVADKQSGVREKRNLDRKDTANSVAPAGGKETWDEGLGALVAVVVFIVSLGALIWIYLAVCWGESSPAQSDDGRQIMARWLLPLVIPVISINVSKLSYCLIAGKEFRPFKLY